MTDIGIVNNILWKYDDEYSVNKRGMYIYEKENDLSFCVIAIH